MIWKISVKLTKKEDKHPPSQTIDQPSQKYKVISFLVFEISNQSTPPDSVDLSGLRLVKAITIDRVSPWLNITDFSLSLSLSL